MTVQSLELYIYAWCPDIHTNRNYTQCFQWMRLFRWPQCLPSSKMPSKLWNNPRKQCDTQMKPHWMQTKIRRRMKKFNILHWDLLHFGWLTCSKLYIVMAKNRAQVRITENTDPLLIFAISLNTLNEELLNQNQHFKKIKETKIFTQTELTRRLWHEFRWLL